VVALRWRRAPESRTAVGPRRLAPASVVGLREHRSLLWSAICLAAEAVKGAALAFERVDDIHGGHSLAARVFSVSHGVTDHVLEEDLEHRARLLVDQAGDALHTTTTRQTADGGLGDALDVVAENLAVTLGAALAETLTALTATGHCL